MKFSNKDLSICDQIRRKLQIWSHLLKKSLKENFIFCSVLQILVLNRFCSLSLWVVSTIFLHLTIFYSLNDTDIASYADNITTYASPSKAILTFADQMTRSAKNTVISPNFLVRKFCRKTYLH